MTGTINFNRMLPHEHENAWSDLLAVILELDPGPLLDLVGVQAVSDISVEHGVPRGNDRIDVLVTSSTTGRDLVAIEAKVLAWLGPAQLNRYAKAFPAQALLLIVPDALGSPGGHPHWRKASWEDVLFAYVDHPHPWIAYTASSWLRYVRTSLPQLHSGDAWNHQRTCAPPAALRTNCAWLSRQLAGGVPAELTGSSGNSKTVLTMQSPNHRNGHFAFVELEDGYNPRRSGPLDTYAKLVGPKITIGLWQDGVNTSHTFDWNMLSTTFWPMVHAASTGVNFRARPGLKDKTDKKNQRAVVAAGGFKGLGYGSGNAQAKRPDCRYCLFGVREQMPSDVKMGDIVARLSVLATVLQNW